MPEARTTFGRTARSPHGVVLGAVGGFEISLDYSWFVIFFLILGTFTGAVFPAYVPGLSERTYLAMGLAGTALFFVSLLVHELAHAYVARWRGLQVEGITLFIFGGATTIDAESRTPREEALIAVAGPAASIAIGAIFIGLDAVVEQPQVGALIGWLGVINLVLAIFNLIPGFPMDGGRVLRAIAWRMTGDIVRATKIAAGIGQFIAAAFIVIGFFRFFSGAGFGGLWIAFIGWFLLDAARASGAQVEINERLTGVRVGDVMAQQFETVDANSNLQTFVHEHLLPTGQRCFVVIQQGMPVGIITPHEVKTVDRARWPYKTVGDVMRPLDSLQTVSAERPLAEALEMMGREDVNQMPVVQQGRLMGIISRAHILRVLQTRAELDV